MANLGDSRIYGVLESGLAQITGDQNVRGTKLRLHQPHWNSRDGAALVGHLGRFIPGEDNHWVDDLPHPDFFTINLLTRRRSCCSVLMVSLTTSATITTSHIKS